VRTVAGTAIGAGDGGGVGVGAGEFMSGGLCNAIETLKNRTFYGVWRRFPTWRGGGPSMEGYLDGLGGLFS
jgi:hypothetical protein